MLNLPSYSSFSHNMQTLPSDIFGLILNNLHDIYDVAHLLSVCKHINRVPTIYNPFNKLKMFGRISQELDDIDLFNLMLTCTHMYDHPEMYSRIEQLQYDIFMEQLKIEEYEYYEDMYWENEDNWD